MEIYHVMLLIYPVHLFQSGDSLKQSVGNTCQGRPTTSRSTARSKTEKPGKFHYKDLLQFHELRKDTLQWLYYCD